MNDDERAGLGRCTAVWVVATLTLAALVAGVLPDLVAARDAASGPGLDGVEFDRLLVWLCSGVALIGGAWLWSITTAVTLFAARGRPQASLPGVPAVLRRALLAACGVALSGGLAAPALATPGELHQDRTGNPATAVVTGLPLPDRATGGLPGGAHVARGRSIRAPRPPAKQADAVVVRPGDSLWSLAEQHLGGGSAWPRIYDLNRDAIGSDPDVIHPDQRLRLPRR